MKKIDLSGTPFHFIGIGGIGMSGLAYILANRGLPVSGSDLRSSPITERLESVGVKIFIGQGADNLNGNSNTQIIRSTAIAPDNLEYQAALELGCEIFHRAQLLAALIAEYNSIAVAGTHGKTTTSSMIAYLLLLAGLDPTIIVGGEVKAFEGNARLGKNNLLVAEADESDGSLSQHCPAIGVITNIELDHTDHYESIQEVVSIFQAFAFNSQNLIACIDCDLVRHSLKPTITYSLKDPSADYLATNILYDGTYTVAQVWEKGVCLGKIKLTLLGEHNVSNALAAVAVGRKLGLSFAVIEKALASFEGAKRRFEFRGEAKGIIFIDDYAHHPSEVKVTLAAARLRVEQQKLKRVVAIFQPHRYSRTSSFMEDFATAFKDADLVITTDIYSAGETNTTLVTGEKLANSIALNHPQLYYFGTLPSLTESLPKILQPGDLVLFLSAGNLNQIIPHVLRLCVD